MSNYINDLPILRDILNEIECTEYSSNFSLEEEADFIDSCVQLLTEYNEDNPTAISEPDFEEDMLNEVKDLIFNTHYNNFFNNHDDIEEDLDNLMDIALEQFYSQIMPKRSYIDTFETKFCENERNRLIRRLKELAEIPQSVQRTREWYETRHRLITASNAYKAFESESTKNQLIYEKCQPLCLDPAILSKPEQVNTNTPMHWGQKYEPLSVMYYEDLFNTTVSEYGCIQHDKFHFLGASPDGIMSDPLKPRFGRMLEIKNIVNRDIDGIPKKEYWIQMQLQMETCDLNECDFLETRFQEYNNYNEFKEDGSFLLSKTEKKKGIIMYFSSKEGKPTYIYKPLNMEEPEFEDVWEQEKREIMEANGLTWLKNIYWRLEEVSCVLVLRNRFWFEHNIGQLQEVWNTILRERQTGSQHRAPNKRVKKESDPNSQLTEMCLLNINKLSNKITVIKKDEPLFSQIIKIRTESMDETSQNLH